MHSPSYSRTSTNYLQSGHKCHSSSTKLTRRSLPSKELAPQLVKFLLRGWRLPFVLWLNPMCIVMLGISKFIQCSCVFLHQENLFGLIVLYRPIPKMPGWDISDSVIEDICYYLSLFVDLHFCNLVMTMLLNLVMTMLLNLVMMTLLCY